MVKRYIHIRIKNPKSCDSFRTIDPGKLNHTKMVLCIKGRGRQRKSSIQNIEIQKHTKTFKRELSLALDTSRQLCKRNSQRLIKSKDGYKCK